MKKIYLNAFALWILFDIIAILNNTFSESILSHIANEQTVHLLSTFLFIILIFAMSYFFVKSNLSISSLKELIWIGVFWVFLTTLFEFVFKHFIMLYPWNVLFMNYNIFKCRLWGLVLIATFLAPYLCGKWLQK